MAKRKAASEPAIMGRPTKYNPELAQRICDAIAESSWGQRRLCKENEDFPTIETIRQWRNKNSEFSALYDQAKKQQAENLAEDILEIAFDDSGDYIYGDDGIKLNSEFVARSRVKIDACKWLACKLIPKVYGDKVQTETNVVVETHEDRLKRQIEELMP